LVYRFRRVIDDAPLHFHDGYVGSALRNIEGERAIEHPYDRQDCSLSMRSITCSSVHSSSSGISLNLTKYDS